MMTLDSVQRAIVAPAQNSASSGCATITRARSTSCPASVVTQYQADEKHRELHHLWRSTWNSP
jgi:hypothetical protein